MNLKKNYLCLSMFPYPSGNLHLGHLRNYIINDINNRWTSSFNKLLAPMFMGWDCFGTPAENASIDNNTLPSLWIKKNIFKMKSDLSFSNIFIKWKKEIFTSKKKFFYLNFLLISKLIKKKFLYLDNKLVNWDSYEKTILSNEQVLDGRGWRSGKKIKKINFLTYYIKLTYYKEELLYELNNLKWPEKLKLMQKNWINKVYNYLFTLIITFYSEIINFFYSKKLIFNSLNNFFFIINKRTFKFFFIYFFQIKKIFKKKYFYSFKKETNLYNLGFNFNNLYKFTLNEFFIFYKKYSFKNSNLNLFINSYNYNIKYNYYNYYLIKQDSNFITLNIFKNYIILYDYWNLYDWGISRQKYWGTPISVYNCKICKKNSLIYNKINLPKNLKSNLKKNILKKNNFFSTIKCKNCNNFAFFESETCDTFLDSSWYFFFYFFKNKNWFKIINKWFPIDIYIGGIEHSILHLLYSRFIIKFLRDEKYLLFGEPFKEILSQGMILNQTYYIKNKNKIIWLNKNSLYKKKKNNNWVFYLKTNKKKVFLGKIEKMSKSKKNNTNFIKIIDKYGIDCLRVFIFYIAPITQNLIWSSKNLKKVFKKLKKWLLYLYQLNLKKNFYYLDSYISFNDKTLLLYFYKNLKKIFYFYNFFYYNNILSVIFTWFNLLNKYKIKNYFLLRYLIFLLIKVFNPFVPKLTKSLIYYLKYKKFNFTKKLYRIILKSKINYIIINCKKKIIFNIKKNIFLRKKINNIFFFNIKKNINIFLFFFHKKIINVLIKN